MLTQPVPPLVGIDGNPFTIVSVTMSINSPTFVCAAASPLFEFVVCEVTDCKELYDALSKI